MKSSLTATDDLVRAYWNLFVNRLAYTVQSPAPHAETGKHYYYRPKRKGHSVPLSHATIRRHLEGELTIGLYAINPSTQRCRWVAIDADYEAALEDLLSCNRNCARMAWMRRWKNRGVEVTSGFSPKNPCWL